MMKTLAMKDLSAGAAGFLSMAGRPDEFLAPVVIGIYRRVMGSTAEQLIPVRFKNGALFLNAKDESWLREGKKRSKIIRSAINTAAACEIVNHVKFERGVVQLERTDSKIDNKVPASSKPPKKLVEAAALIRDVKLREAFIEFGSKVMLSASYGKRKG